MNHLSAFVILYVKANRGKRIQYSYPAAGLFRIRRDIPKRVRTTLISALFFSWLLLGPGAGGNHAWGATLELNREAVFCLYYSISGERIMEQDIEDLCHSLDQPTYTLYKPSEMFTKASLRRWMHTLEQKKHQMGHVPLFKMRLEAKLHGKRSPFQSLLGEEADMPQPTPFIRSEISERGVQGLRRIFSHERFRELRRGANTLKIDLFLRPEKVVEKPQKRLIAGEKVYLPIRYVVFSLVRMEIFSSDHEPNKMLISIDIDKF